MVVHPVNSNFIVTTVIERKNCCTKNNYQIKHFAETSHEVLQECNETHRAVEDETNMAKSGYHSGVAEDAGLLGLTPYRPANSCRQFKGKFCLAPQFQAVLRDGTLLGHLAVENGDTKILRQAGNYITVDTA
jgi:hypothetical protein